MKNVKKKPSKKPVSTTKKSTKKPIQKSAKKSDKKILIAAKKPAPSPEELQLKRENVHLRELIKQAAELALDGCDMVTAARYWDASDDVMFRLKVNEIAENAEVKLDVRPFTTTLDGNTGEHVWFEVEEEEEAEVAAAIAPLVDEPDADGDVIGDEADAHAVDNGMGDGPLDEVADDATAHDPGFGQSGYADEETPQDAA